jgi:SHS2 domain-containing protein
MPDDTRFEYLEHTADAKFRAYGRTIEEVFENAALAMFNVMIATDHVRKTESKKIEITSADMDGLLVDWLSELLYLFDAEQMVFGKFEVERIKEHNGEYSLSGSASGEPIDLARHEFDTEVKAVTYNELKIEEMPNGWVVQVVVDT